LETGKVGIGKESVLEKIQIFTFQTIGGQDKSTGKKYICI